MRTGKPIIETGWVRALLLLVIIIFIYTIGLYFFSFGVGSTANTSTRVNLPFYGQLTVTEVLLLSSSLFSIAIVFLFCRLVNRVSFSSLGFSFSNRQSYAGIVLAPALLGIGIMILYWTGHLSWVAWGIDQEILLPAVMFLFIVSFSEEVIFRGYILQNLMQSFNKWIAVFVSSVVFACMHANNPEMNLLAFANLVAAGLLLGTGYLYTGNLWFSIFFHFCWNFFQGPVLGFPVSGLNMSSVFQISVTGDQLITGGLFGFEGSIIALGLVLVTSMLLMWNMEKRGFKFQVRSFKY